MAEKVVRGKSIWQKGFMHRGKVVEPGRIAEFTEDEFRDLSARKMVESVEAETTGKKGKDKGFV